MADERGGMKRRLRVIALVVVLAVIVLAVVNSIRNRPQNSITLSGTIEATDVVLSSKVNAKIVAVNAQEGDRVRKGEVLVGLRQDEFRDAVNQASAVLADAQAKLQEALNGTRAEDIQQAEAQVAQDEADVAGARRSLALAEEDYRDVTDLRTKLDAAQTVFNATRHAYEQARQAQTLVQEGPRVEDIQQAEAALRQAQASNKLAQDDFKRDQALFKRGAISASQLDAGRSAADVSQAQVGQAQARLSELQAGSRPEEIHQANAAASQAAANLAGARKALADARQQYDKRLSQRQALTSAQTQYNTSSDRLRQSQARLKELKVGTRPEEIAQFRDQSHEAEAALAQSKIQLGDTTVVSPLDARVITRSVEPGELATVGSALMEVADLDTVWLRVYVEEPVYGRIKLGDSATVTVDSYPGKTFTGRITEINQDAEFTPKEIQTAEQRAKLVFGIKITLSNPEGKLKPGMPADATLRLAPS
jgi:multidrug resistance efflux pump